MSPPKICSVSAWPSRLKRSDVVCVVREVAPSHPRFLSDEERARADRFRRSEDRDAYVQAHELKRHVLSRLTGLPRNRLRFGTREGGKPILLDGQLDFNLSHSTRWVAFAVGVGCDVGVDVEGFREFDWTLVAPRVFSDLEMQTCRSADCLDTAFFKLWVTKEAAVKAWGQGLSLPLREMTTTRETTGWLAADLASNTAKVLELPLPRATAALAVCGESTRRVFLDIPGTAEVENP